MKKIRVEDAVGTVLAHDLTKIVPGEVKKAAFKKGYIVREEDIEELKSLGKNHLYILELNDDILHEEEAAERIARAVAGANICLTPPSEGKVNLKAKEQGLLKIDLDLLSAITDMEMIVLATLHNNTMVDKDKLVAGAKVIPLTIAREPIEQIENLCRGKSVISVKPMQSLAVGIVVTGTEVCNGIIADRFGPILADTVTRYGCSLTGLTYAVDNVTAISQQIEQAISDGARIVMISGGMSVDADDVTPQAIEQCADEIVSYGSPVLPGAMFMLAYRGDIPLLGVPACGMFHRITVLDLILPRLLADERLNRKDLSRLAHGGLCQNCDPCHYPNCAFGK